MQDLLSAALGCTVLVVGCLEDNPTTISMAVDKPACRLALSTDGAHLGWRSLQGLRRAWRLHLAVQAIWQAHGVEL